MPVCVGNRAESYSKITSQFPEIDVILLDDGLQQQSLFPDKKILVIDERLFGNGFLLPYGPLRETLPLDYDVDATVFNNINEKINVNDCFKRLGLKKNIPFGYLEKKSLMWKNIINSEIGNEELKQKISLNYITTKIKPLAVAGIAVPNRFFMLLKKLEIDFEPLWLENHDTNFIDNLSYYLNSSERIVLMTEKDGVKLVYSKNANSLNKEQFWIVKLNLQLGSNFVSSINNWI